MAKHYTDCNELQKTTNKNKLLSFNDPISLYIISGFLSYLSVTPKEKKSSRKFLVGHLGDKKSRSRLTKQSFC